MDPRNGPGVNGVDLIASNQTEVVKCRKRSRVTKKNKLSDDQVRRNHVVSEQRRRELVRGIYDDLVEIVPGLERGERRSELVIYLKTINRLKWLYKRNLLLREKLREKYQAEGKSNPAIPEWLVWDLPRESDSEESKKQNQSSTSE